MSATPRIADLVEPPQTPHLAWLGASRPRAKVLADGMVRAILARPVSVEEAPDGALIGIDFPLRRQGGGGGGERLRSEQGVPSDGESARIARRAQVLGPGAHPQFQPLAGWIATREAALQRALGKELVLFGYWCFAVHAVRHDALPDWFLCSDVFERTTGRCWSAERRNALAKRLGLATPPEVLRSKVDAKGLTARLAAAVSQLGSGPVAGFVVRLEQGDHLVERAQLLRAEVADAPEDPPTKKTLEHNALAGIVCDDS